MDNTSHSTPLLLSFEVLSADYGPHESAEDHRDVTPQILDWLCARPDTAQRVAEQTFVIPSLPNGMPRVSVTLLEGYSMNAVFGDPCVGSTKQLTLQIWWQHSSSSPNDTTQHTFLEHETVVLQRPIVASTDAVPTSTTTTTNNQSTSALTPATTELLLPLLLPWLSVAERMTCPLVCRHWRDLIRRSGVARVIDVHTLPHLTPTRLQGLLEHSFASLTQLHLSGSNVRPEDLHRVLPHLTKLQQLDVSFCRTLDDTTLQLVAQHCREFLHVLYVKELVLVTDVGIVALAQHCLALRVLDVSLIPNLTNVSLDVLQQRSSLKASYLRDSALVTKAYGAELEQLTLWGCFRLTTLALSSQLVSLNLLGCHGLKNVSLEGLVNLRSLVLWDCPGWVTDAFMVGSRSSPQSGVVSVSSTHHF